MNQIRKLTRGVRYLLEVRYCEIVINFQFCFNVGIWETNWYDNDQTNDNDNADQDAFEGDGERRHEHDVGGSERQHPPWLFQPTHFQVFVKSWEPSN